MELGARMICGSILWRTVGLLLLSIPAEVFFSPIEVQAGGFKSPEECLAYTGEAHINCLYAYIEIQQGKISRLQEEVNAHKATAGRLQDRLEQQASVTEHLQDRIKDRDQLIEGYRYAPIGPLLGLSFSYGYGAPFYYGRRFFGSCYGPFYSYPCW